MSMGKRIKKLRKENRLTMDALGKIIGVQRPAIYKYEHDQIKGIPIETLQKLAEALSTTPNYLLGFDTDSQIEDAEDHLAEAYAKNDLVKIDVLEESIRDLKFAKAMTEVEVKNKINKTSNTTMHQPSLPIINIGDSDYLLNMYIDLDDNEKNELVKYAEFLAFKSHFKSSNK